MDSKTYIEKAMRTEARDYFFGSKEMPARIEHGVIGIVTEAGELMDAVKKTKIYRKELDKVNLIEELGDIFWYTALLCDELGVSFEDIMDKNIAKLEARYPEKYSHDNAINRNTDTERAILEA